MEWLSTNQIKVTPPKRPKKITGTRFGAILGVNKWNTPFKTWCEITKTWEEPFSDNKYTIAGKTIEPKQAEYMRKAYFMENLVTPADVFGEDYFNRTRGDFFKDFEIFGGMWDYLLKDENGNVTTVLEMKTTSRSEDWSENVPEYYALQAALYAYLLGVDEVIMVASFLESKDYDNPEAFKPSAENTMVIPFKVSEAYPQIEEYVKQATEWWYDHIKTGVSPEYDEKADSEILKELRTNSLNPDTDIQQVLAEAEQIQAELGVIAEQTAEKEQRLKILKDIIKEYAIPQFREGDTKVTLQSPNSIWTVSVSELLTIDKAKLKADGLLEKYSKSSNSYKLTNKPL